MRPVRRILREAFEAEHFEVADATNGAATNCAEGVQKAQEIKPSLIILDLSMPVMNGLEAASKLKALMPTVPLLMFTNNTGGIVDTEARFCRYLCGSFQVRIRLVDEIRSLT
jgi:CheY-like chemotaxis protein